MPRIKLKLEEGYLDTFERLDNEFYTTAQIFDLRSLQSRSAGYTRNFSIPSTNNNLTLLGRLQNEQFGNSAYWVLLEIDGISFGVGSLYITSQNKQSLDVVLFDFNFTLFDNIPDESIKELDFSSENFAWNVTNLATKGATTSGAILPAVQWLSYEDFDNGQGTPSQLFNYDEINNYGLGFHAKDIFAKIIESLGFTYTHMTGDDNYNDLVILFPVNVPALVNPSIYGTLNHNY